MATGTISHIEFPADDVERAKTFYAAVAGWDYNEMDGIAGYWLFRTAPRPAARSASAARSVGDAVRVYIDVDDLEGAVDGGHRQRRDGRSRRRRTSRARAGSRPSATPRATRSGCTRTPAPDLPRRQPLPPQRRPVRGRRRPGRRRAPGWPVSSGSSSRAGTSPRPSARSRASSGSRGWTRPSASIRTTRPRSTTAGWGRIVGWAADPRVVAIGETGLDYDRVFSPIPDQLTNLRRNLALALETGKPAILHCRSAAGRRDAQDALVDELRAAGVGGPAWAAAFADRPPAVIHSFSGPVDYARTVIDLGLAVSFSGLVFRAGEEASAEVAAIVPADRVLIETDSPFLAPPGAPRSRNEPEWVRVTGAWLAERRATTPDALGADLVAAYDRTFPSERRPA